MSKGKAPIIESNLVTLTPMEARDLLVEMMRANIKTPVMLVGPPGAGKSSIVHQAAAIAGRHSVADIRLSQLGLLDLRGLPYTVEQSFETTYQNVKSKVTEMVTRTAVPSMFPRTPGGVVFFDEMNMAVPTIVGVTQQILLDRRLGENYTVPEDTFMCAAGNRKQDMAAIHNLPQPVNNRMYHIEVTTSVEDFARYAIETGNIDPNVVAFIRTRPNLLMQFDKESPTWPSPRAWEKASDLYRHNIRGGDVTMAVGPGPAGEFRKFITIIEQLPQIESILSGAEKNFKFPAEQEPDKRWAMTTAMAAAIKSAAELDRALRWVTSKNSEWIVFMLADFIARPKTDKVNPQEILMELSRNPENQEYMQSIMSANIRIR